MLRITCHKPRDGEPTIRLEGKLLGPWVEEVSQVCAAAGSSGRRPRLDLSALSFADAEGIALLRALRARDVAIVAGSGYIAEMLDGGRP